MATPLPQRQRAFEVLLADLSSRFANVSGDEVERQIEIALRQLIAFFGFDRSSFAELDAEGRLTRWLLSPPSVASRSRRPEHN